MNRRRYLQTTAGAFGAITAASLAGCVSDSGEAEPANEFEYETMTNEEIPVPLVPTEDAGEWFEEDDVVFVDTRDREAYEETRIADALLSPAPNGQSGDDPVEELDTETRIVTYCVCPHHLATLRGESLIAAGYEHTYALDEGLQEWMASDLPVEGNSTEQLEISNEYHTEQ